MHQWFNLSLCFLKLSGMKLVVEIHQDSKYEQKSLETESEHMHQDQPEKLEQTH